MENFEQKKMNINSINNGQKFTSGSQLTPEALNSVVEGINQIDKKFQQVGLNGQDRLNINNGVTDTRNTTDNRAICIGNTQSIGTDLGALRFWNIVNDKIYLDISPTEGVNSTKKTTLGEQNKFESIHGKLVQGETVQAGKEKVSINEIYSVGSTTFNLANVSQYKLIMVSFYCQVHSGEFCVFNDLIYLNTGKSYDLNDSDCIRHQLNNGNYIDVTRSGNTLLLRPTGGYSNYGIEAIYGILLK